ncbi:hypothetical protein RRG08_028260 [Elysia crispata]|uniref:Uncharacterized protein n=1 Tax=Elysia crispata TaxID=231223 RepID=A0AAE0ZK12_9GAST|nr:hypothetical protein RRG08_028260 [Elysia crispata]
MVSVASLGSWSLLAPARLRALKYCTTVFDWLSEMLIIRTTRGPWSCGASSRVCDVSLRFYTPEIKARNTSAVSAPPDGALLSRT